MPLLHPWFIPTYVHKHSHFRRYSREKWHLLPFTRCADFCFWNCRRNDARIFLFSLALSRNKSPFVVISYSAKCESETRCRYRISFTWSRINYDKTWSYFFNLFFLVRYELRSWDTFEINCDLWFVEYTRSSYFK